MNLRNIVLFCVLTSTNAQVVQTLFNIASDFFVSAFNDAIGAALSGSDPHELNLVTSIPLGKSSGGDCDDITVFGDTLVHDLFGLSSVRIEELKMDYFCADLPDLGVGYGFESIISFLSATLEGNLTGVGCGQTRKQAFTGTANITNADFLFDFGSYMSFAAGFAVDNVTINAFNITWDDIDIELSDLGELNDIGIALKDALFTSVTLAINTLVNKTLLQEGIDNVVPFSIP